MSRFWPPGTGPALRPAGSGSHRLDLIIAGGLPPSPPRCFTLRRAGALVAIQPPVRAPPTQPNGRRSSWRGRFPVEGDPPDSDRATRPGTRISQRILDTQPG